MSISHINDNFTVQHVLNIKSEDKGKGSDSSYIYINILDYVKLKQIKQCKTYNRNN